MVNTDNPWTRQNTNKIFVQLHESVFLTLLEHQTIPTNAAASKHFDFGFIMVTIFFLVFSSIWEKWRNIYVKTNFAETFIKIGWSKLRWNFPQYIRMSLIITDFPDVNKSHMINTSWGENAIFWWRNSIMSHLLESFDVPAGYFCAVVCQKYNLYGLVTSIFVAKYMSQHK